MAASSKQKQLPAQVAQMLDAAAARYGLPNGLVRAVAWIESRGNALARSPVGAIGIMQLMPATAKSLGVDPHDPLQNVDGGARLLAQLIKQYSGDVQRALAAYNWGSGNLSKAAKVGKPWPSSVIAYVNDVLARGQIEGYRFAGNPLVQRAAAGLPPSSSSQASPPRHSSPPPLGVVFPKKPGDQSN